MRPVPSSPLAGVEPLSRHALLLVLLQLCPLLVVAKAPGEVARRLGLPSGLEAVLGAFVVGILAGGDAVQHHRQGDLVEVAARAGAAARHRLDHVLRCAPCPVAPVHAG